MMRLNRYLSACGLGSRRGCELIITEGRVSINGKICINLATTVGEADEITVDGKKTRMEQGIVIALHKPRGLVCSRHDERDRETIYELLPPKYHTLHHVGRLDKESEGLLLMTNRGELSHKLLHPSQGVEKEYEVTIESVFDPEHIAKLKNGIHTEEGLAKAERAWVIGNYKIGIILKQGLKRQIRLMLFALGYEVRRLVRVRIGGLLLKGMAERSWRELTNSQVDKLLLSNVAKQSSLTRKPASRKAAARKSSSSPRDNTRSGPINRDRDRDGSKPARKRSSGSRDNTRSGPIKRDRDGEDKPLRKRPSRDSTRSGPIKRDAGGEDKPLRKRPSRDNTRSGPIKRDSGSDDRRPPKKSPRGKR